jgi:hypothetical protein
VRQLVSAKYIEGGKDKIESVVQIFGCMLYRSSTLIATTGAASEIIMKKNNWERDPPFT